jgi:surface antigen
MKSIVYTTLTIILLIGMIGCQKHTVGGAGLGGIGGGVIGSQIGSGTGQTAAIISGTLAGAALGGYIGSYLDKMDDMDKRQLNQTLEEQPTDQTTQWKNPDTEKEYQVTPKKTYEKNDTYCREFQTEITVGGETEQGYGTACRQPDGAWKIIDTE